MFLAYGGRPCQPEAGEFFPLSHFLFCFVIVDVILIVTVAIVVVLLAQLGFVGFSCKAPYNS